MSKTMSEICDFNNKSGCELLVDTGTYLTYIPLKIFDVFIIILRKYLKDIHYLSLKIAKITKKVNYLK